MLPRPEDCRNAHAEYVDHFKRYVNLQHEISRCRHVELCHEVAEKYEKKLCGGTLYLEDAANSIDLYKVVSNGCHFNIGDEDTGNRHLHSFYCEHDSHEQGKIQIREGKATILLLNIRS